MVVINIQHFLCVLTFEAYLCEFILRLFFDLVALSGGIYSINMMVTVC